MTNQQKNQYRRTSTTMAALGQQCVGRWLRLAAIFAATESAGRAGRASPKPGSRIGTLNYACIFPHTAS